MMIEYLYRVLTFIEKNIGRLDAEIIESNLFGYDADDNAIYITDEKDELDIAWDVFMLEYLKDEFDLDLRGRGDNVMEMFSLLHEIGHFKTMWMFDYDEYERESDKLDDDDFMSYRRLYGEYLADDWAVTFIRKYPEILNIK